MMYAKFINKNEIEYLPKNAVLDGESFSNARRLPKEKLGELGYYPIEYEKEPDYNAEYEYLQSVYSLEEDKIKVSYEVKELFI